MDDKQAPEQTPVNVDAQELAQAEQRQREAFEALHLWYQDWSHVFRKVMPYHAFQTRFGKNSAQKRHQKIRRQ